MRGGFLLGLGGALLAVGLAGEAVAQAASWPDKPVKLILPYAPGGATDLIGRPWADKLGQVVRPAVRDREPRRRRRHDRHRGGGQGGA